MNVHLDEYGFAPLSLRLNNMLPCPSSRTLSGPLLNLIYLAAFMDFVNICERRMFGNELALGLAI